MTIYNPLTRNTISGRGLQASKGVASSSGAATRGVSSEAEMAAKAPAGANIPNNLIKNPLYADDARYPGAGGRTEEWAGFNASFSADSPAGEIGTLPLTYNSTSAGTIRVYGMPGNLTENLRFRVTLQNEAYPNNTIELTKDIVYTTSDSQSAPFNRAVTIETADFPDGAVSTFTKGGGTGDASLRAGTYTKVDADNYRFGTSNFYFRRVNNIWQFREDGEGSYAVANGAADFPWTSDWSGTDGATFTFTNFAYSQDFNSVLFTLLKADGSVKPTSTTGRNYFQLFNLDFFPSSGGGNPTESIGYGVFGGAVLTTEDYLGGTEYQKLEVRDDSEFGHPNVKSSVNGIGSTWKGNRMPQHWLHYNSLYVSGSTSEFDTFCGKRFYRHRKFDDEFLDIAAKNSVTSISDGAYELGPDQRRIVELFGSTGRITARADDIDKSYPDIPTWGLTHGTLSSSSNISNVNSWVKHSICQSVKIPEGAVSSKYGAYVQVPVNPSQVGPLSGGGVGLGGSFRGNNFGAIQISQDFGEGEGAVPSNTNTRFVRGDSIRFAKETTQSGLPPTTIGSETLNFVQYNWNGLATIHDASASASSIESGINNTIPVHPHGFRYPTNIQTTGITLNDYDYREFKFVEREWKRADQPGYAASGWYQESNLSSYDSPIESIHIDTYKKQIPYLQLELIFYEHSGNLFNISSTNDHGDSIRFFCPYIQFFNANGDIADSNGNFPTFYGISAINVEGGGVTITAPSVPITGKTTTTTQIDLTVDSGKSINYVEVSGLGTEFPLTLTGGGTTWTRSTIDPTNEIGKKVRFKAASRPGAGSHSLILTVASGTQETATIEVNTSIEANLRLGHTGYGSGRVIINGVTENYDDSLSTKFVNLFNTDTTSVSARFEAVGSDAKFDGEPIVSGATLSGDSFNEGDVADVTITWNGTSSNVDITTDGFRD